MTAYDIKPLVEEPVQGSDRLYIIFGGRKSGMGLPQFEFCKSANVLNHNTIFIRDLTQSWYQRGLPGISSNLLDTVTPIKRIVNKYNCNKVITVGNSMGGFAAIYYAAALGNAHAIAFAPQTFIGPIKRLVHKDNRWNREILRTYAFTLFRKKQFNLVNTLQEHLQTNWCADIIEASDHRLDLIHANELVSLAQVSIRKYRSSSHRIVKELRDQGQLTKILLGDFSGAVI